MYKLSSSMKRDMESKHFYSSLIYFSYFFNRVNNLYCNTLSQNEGIEVISSILALFSLLHNHLGRLVKF